MRRGAWTGGADSHDGARSILVLALSGIGNMVMTTPLLAACRAAFPQAQLTVAATPRGSLEVISGGPLRVSSVIVSKGHRGVLLHALQAGMRLRRNRFDLALVCWASQGAFGNLVAKLSGAPFRVGYDSRWAQLLTHRLPVRIGRHETQMNVDLLRALGIEPVVSKPALHFSAADEVAARVALDGVPGPSNGVAALHPGSYANMASKRWPAARFAELGDRIAQVFGLRVALMGGPEERPLAGEVAASMTVPAGVLAGDLSLKQTAAALRQCRLLVANCSGLMHAAVAVGCPVVAIYGPTDWRTSGPTGPGHLVVRSEIPCSPCYTAVTVGRPITCPRQIECMQAITVDDVLEAVRLALQEPHQTVRHHVIGLAIGAANEDAGRVVGADGWR